MTEKERNDYFYVCSLIEYIARETLNHRGDIVKTIGKDGIEKLLYDAEVDHCLSFEQVSDEVIDYYKIAVLIQYQTVNIRFQVFWILGSFIAS